MKKLLPIFALCFLLLCGCTTVKDICTTSDCLPDDWEHEIETGTEIEDGKTLDDAIVDYISANYSCDDQSKLFVDYAELGMKSLGNGIAECYIMTNAEGYYIDERGNLNNSCGFGVPMKITFSSEDGSNYKVIDSVQARDGSEYDISLHEMFSDEAIDILYKGDYDLNNNLLEMAEEYFGVTIIPDEKQNFECKFCDKLRYYNYTPEDDESLKDTNELHFNYISEDNGENTIYFGSDGNFEAKGSRDEGKGTWNFGKDANTVIVSYETLLHVYDRYIIINQDENNLNTILEIIQR